MFQTEDCIKMRVFHLPSQIVFLEVSNLVSLKCLIHNRCLINLKNGEGKGEGERTDGLKRK